MRKAVSNDKETRTGRVLARILAEDLQHVRGGLVLPGGGIGATAEPTRDEHGHPDFTNNASDQDR